MLHTTEFHAMGCRIFIATDSPSQPAAFAQIPKWFDVWEDALSRFRLDSELNKLNRANGVPTQVSQIFAQVFETALAAEKLSNGLVTPVLLDALVSAGYDRSFDLLPQESISVEPEEFRFIPSLDEVDWDPATRIIWLPSDIHLDFGGVGKGWAAQQTAQQLQVHGPSLVDAHGDIAVTGPQADGSLWKIDIANPFDPGTPIGTIGISSGGVATSGRDARYWYRNGKLAHHIIDPRTGMPAETDVLTATVIAPSVTLAEAATKTILISGSFAGLEWLEDQSEFAALLVLDDGQMVYTDNMEKYFTR